MLRGMFPDSSDSEDEGISNPYSSPFLPTAPQVTTIMDVKVVQEPEAGISSKIWPAATHLASYLLNQDPPPSPPPRIIELGAGVGLTGIKLSKCWGSRVILTDLSSALPLLQSNIEANSSSSNVTCAPLAWGTEDWSSVVSLCSSFFSPLEASNSSTNPSTPFDLIVAADCVYWEELHEPLRQTLLSLLSSSPTSKCFLCGMRRWKSDNSFYKSLSKVQSPSGRLSCTMIDEIVRRVERKVEASEVVGEEDDYFDDVEVEEREVIRIYEVKFVAS